MLDVCAHQNILNPKQMQTSDLNSRLCRFGFNDLLTAADYYCTYFCIPFITESLFVHKSLLK